MGIYQIKGFDKKQYSWNPESRKLRRRYRICEGLSLFIFLLFLGLVLWYGAFRLNEFTLKFGGYCVVFLSGIFLYCSLRALIIRSFQNRSANLEPEARHDFALLEYHSRKGRSPETRNHLLLLMAQMDLVQGKAGLAAAALQAAEPGRMKADQLKMYDFLWIVTCLQEEDQKSGEITDREVSGSAGDWLTRYQGIPDNGVVEFPKDEEIEKWVRQIENSNENTGVSAQENRVITTSRVVTAASKAKHRNVFALPLFFIMLFHVSFFFGVCLFPANGWHLRIHYENIATNLTILFIYILGIWVIRLDSSWRRKLYPYAGRGNRAGNVIRNIIVLGFLFVCLAMWWFQWFFTFGDYTERVLTRGIHDVDTGETVDYLAVDMHSYNNSNGTSYYRAQDFILMEDWFAARYYDPEWVDPFRESNDDTGETGNTGTGQTDEIEVSSADAATADQSESDISNTEPTDQESAIARAYPDTLNQYSLVYEYLKSASVIPDSAWTGSIQYDLDAKGNPYAIVGRDFTEVNGNQVEVSYCLLDNGEKTTEDGSAQEEIVLEKFYSRDSADTELLGFYLVDKETGAVTDEHKTSW